ncbi:hypothetical protein CDIK_0699 [Cucumispora dikerogammari]|nr:hypothetical protein CDIK_0699 [Cucumispora dikerogammari]
MEICEICTKPLIKTEGFYICERGHVMSNPVEVADDNVRLITRRLSRSAGKTRERKIKQKLKKTHGFTAEAFLFIASEIISEFNQLKTKPLETKDDYYLSALGYFFTLCSEATQEEMNLMLKLCLYLHMRLLFEAGDISSEYLFVSETNVNSDIEKSEISTNKTDIKEGEDFFMITRVKNLEKNYSNKKPFFIEDFESFYTLEKVTKYLTIYEKAQNIIFTKRLLNNTFCKLSPVDIKKGIEFFTKYKLKLPPVNYIDLALKAYDRIVFSYEMLNNLRLRDEEINWPPTKHLNFPRKLLFEKQIDVKSLYVIKALYLKYYEQLIIEQPFQITYEDPVLVFLFLFAKRVSVSVNFHKLELADKQYIGSCYAVNRKIDEVQSYIDKSDKPISFVKNNNYYNTLKILFYLKVPFLKTGTRDFSLVFCNLIEVFNKMFFYPEPRP